MAIKKSGKPTKTTTEPTYKVLEEIATISSNAKGWELKLRYMAWNGNGPKYDLRSWLETEDGEKCSKGITLTGEELEALYNAIGELMAEPELMEETEETEEEK